MKKPGIDRAFLIAKTGAANAFFQKESVPLLADKLDLITS